MNAQSYAAPVNKLLSLGDPRQQRQWPDYRAMGLGPEHIPDLIRMATDEGRYRADADELEFWAPLHAWRALGQLRAEAAIAPLLGLLRRVDEDDDDWVAGELPEVFEMIGPAAIGPLRDYLADSRHPLYARAAASEALGKIGRKHPETRAESVAALAHQLDQFAENDPVLNGLLLGRLLDLRAVEAAPVMERAFAADRVDESISGDWEDAQIELRLKTQREHPRRPNVLTQMVAKVRASLPPGAFPVPGSTHAQPAVDLLAIYKARKQARSKQKKAKKARMRQRQRK